MFSTRNVKLPKRPRKPAKGDGKKRNPHTKSRKGCKTCKIRRVKCDEGKPHCDRCTKFGIVCDGYARVPDKASPIRRKVLPNLSSQESSLDSIQCLQTGPRFETEQEHRFYRFYCHKIAVQLSGPFKTSLWESLIPQACEAEPYVRHAVVSFGALNHVLYEGIKTWDHLGPPNYRNPMYEYALKQYDKALKSMRTAIASGRHDIRMVLLACLLVFLFESLQGNPYSACMNAKNGLVLLEEWKTTSSSRGAAYGGTRTIEDDIISAYAGLDLQVLFFLDTRTQKEHQAAVYRYAALCSNIPSEFETFEQVRNFWVTMQSRNYHFNILATDARSDPAVSGRGRHHEAQAVVTDNMYENVFTPFAPISASALEWKKQMEGYREEIRRWTRASASILKKVEKCGSPEERATMALLKIHSNLNHIQLAGTFLTNETEYDIFLPEYKAIVENSELVYPYLASSPSNPGGIYRFFSGILYPLSATGFRCRDKSIRARAIELLQKGPYREGMLNSLSVGCLTNWIRNIEEEDMDENGFIPESSRVIMTLCEVAPGGKTALLGCTSVIEGGLKSRKEVVQWNTVDRSHGVSDSKRKSHKNE